MKKKFGFVLIMISIFVVHSQNIDKSEKSLTRVLFIVSNAHFYGETDMSTSNHFSEIINAYDVFYQNGYTIDFLSPEGGALPVGYIDTSKPLQKKYLYDSVFMDKLEYTKKPSQVKSSDYAAVYYVGGGAAMFGVPQNKEIQRIVMELYEDYNGVISAVCHGTAGIVNLKKEDGTYLYQGKKVSGFPDKFERKEARYYKTFPFSIQQIIKDRGGVFEFSDEGWDGFMVSDGRLISGQDPTSSDLIARKVIEILEDKS